jgi:uroporphyrin-III C-methyltransferase
MSKVYLVGAGPGDPELLTLKGRRCLESADVVLYDHLAAPALLDFAPSTAERNLRRQEAWRPRFSQTEIIDVVLAKAREDKTVVRLKGGDPFIFGRGGEEIEALAEAGIPFEVVPGVTAPLGIAAYTGVPLTHREHTSVVTFVTGHNVDSIDWTKTASPKTLVIFMGVHHASEIIERILAAGRDPEPQRWPCAGPLARTSRRSPEPSPNYRRSSATSLPRRLSSLAMLSAFAPSSMV